MRMSDLSAGGMDRFQRGFLGAALGLLTVASLAISIVLLAGAPGQVTLVKGQKSWSAPPQIITSLSLRNHGRVEVRADPVIYASFALSDGSEVEKTCYFRAVTLEAGTVTLSGWTLALPQGEVTGVNVTACFRMRGPISEAALAYSLP
jgi:hypothetical protein